MDWIQEECPTDKQNNNRKDTGQHVDHSNFWAADRGLTNLFHAIGIKVERFSRPLNFNKNFKVSYSARNNDKAFGLKFDGLFTHHLNKNERTRDFLTDSLSHNNPEYEDEMMLDTMDLCAKAVTQANQQGVPTRHVMLVPFVPGNKNHWKFRGLQAQAPQDIREWIIFPNKTYPFWQFGYWLGINKLAKKRGTSIQTRESGSPGFW